MLLVEATDVFRRRRFHRRKAHLILSALRHRAAELGERGQLVRAGTYGAALRPAGVDPDRPVSVCDPTSWGARRLVRSLADGSTGSGAGAVQVLRERGYAVPADDFRAWADGRGRKRLLQDDLYRRTRRRLGLLMEADGEPVGGSWSYDTDNREPPPRGARSLGESMVLPQSWWPEEDDIDSEVRDDLDRMVAEDGVVFIGDDGPRRFAATHSEAKTALRHFLEHRLDAFGTYEDAMLSGDRWMAHSLLSAPLNLGLLDPVEVARTAERGLGHGARLASVEGFVRQVVGWRDYV